MPPSLSIFTDGGARGNPGPAAIGVVIKDQSGRIVHQFGEAIGETTNNVAEYRAVIAALDYLLTQSELPGQVNFFLDSRLVVEQLRGNWKIKEAHLRDLALRAQQLVSKLGARMIYTAVPREQNSAADKLVNQALDK
jgi:ribonuclease HI